MKATAVILTGVLGLLAAGAVSRSYRVEGSLKESPGADLAPVPIESVDATAVEEVSVIPLGEPASWHFIELP